MKEKKFLGGTRKQWIVFVIIVIILLIIAGTGAHPSIVLDPSQISGEIYLDENITTYMNIINYGQDTNQTKGKAYNLTFSSVEGVSFNPVTIKSLEGNGSNIINHVIFKPDHAGIYSGISTLSFVYPYLDNGTWVNVTNTSLQKTVTFNVTVKYRPANISVSMLDDSLEMLWNETEQAVVVVDNHAAYTAHNVSLEYPYGNFSEKFFDLGPSGSKVVFLNISLEPLINDTDDTNKTYSFNITASGVNFPEYNKTVKVFIPYYNFIAPKPNTTINYEQFWKDLEAFCKTFPASPWCLTEQKVVYKNQTVEVPAVYKLNFTEKELKKLLGNIDLVQERTRTLESDVRINKEELAKQSDHIYSLLEFLNNTYELAKANKEAMENEKRQALLREQIEKKRQEDAEKADFTNKIILTFFTVVLLFIGCVSVAGFYYFKKYKEYESGM